MTDRADAGPLVGGVVHGGRGPCCCRACGDGSGSVVLGDVWRDDLSDVHTEHHHHDNDDYYGCTIDHDYVDNDGNIHHRIYLHDDGTFRADDNDHDDGYANDDHHLEHHNDELDDAAAPAD